jgi:4-amino-4-deoxychorismate lyase
VSVIAWLDGQPIEALPVTDRGLHYGDGLFETLAVQGGHVRRLSLHLGRLQGGCARLGLPQPDAAVLQRELQQAAANQDRAVLKLMLTRGSGGRGYRPPEQPIVSRLLLRYPWPDYPAEWSGQGIELRICHTRLARNPVLAGLKHLNRLEQVLARNEWSEGAQEGLMLDTEGWVIEGTMCNVFGSSAQGKLVTPDLSQAGVAGVMRHYILERAQGQGLEVEVRSLSLGELLECQELFLCNSIAGVWPVRCIESRNYSVGPLTRLAAGWAMEP